MFAGQKNMGKKIAQIVKYFSDYDTHLTHARPISIEKLQKYKLSLSYSESELSELLWEAHILIMGFFNILGFVKLFENAHGVSWGKQIQVVQQGPIPAQVPPQAKPTPKP
jgi:hypothetical protein